MSGLRSSEQRTAQLAAVFVHKDRPRHYLDRLSLSHDRTSCSVEQPNPRCNIPAFHTYSFLPKSTGQLIEPHVLKKRPVSRVRPRHQHSAHPTTNQAASGSPLNSNTFSHDPWSYSLQTLSLPKRLSLYVRPALDSHIRTNPLVRLLSNFSIQSSELSSLRS